MGVECRYYVVREEEVSCHEPLSVGAECRRATGLGTVLTFRVCLFVSTGHFGVTTRGSHLRRALWDHVLRMMWG